MRALTLITMVACCGALGTSRTRAQPATDPAQTAVPEPAPVPMPAPSDPGAPPAKAEPALLQHTARRQAPAPPEQDPAAPGEEPRHQASVDFAFFDNKNISLASWILAGSGIVADVVEIGGKWGMSRVQSDFIGEAKVRVGNPYIFAHYVDRTGLATYRIGGGLALPLAPAHDFADLYGASFAAPLRSTWDVWLWNPLRLSLVFPSGSVVLRPTPSTFVGAEGALGTLVYTGENNGGVALVGQTALDGGVALAPFQLGLRLQAVATLASDQQILLTDPSSSVKVEDRLQTSLQPYVRVGFSPGFVRAALTVNLDEPFGFSFEENKVWAINVGGGVEM